MIVTFLPFFPTYFTREKGQEEEEEWKKGFFLISLEMS